MKGDRIRGFTLVELLAVVSILSLLAALLFPVFADAKRGAYRASCQSNLHQIGLAFTLYAGDSDDQCPYAIDAHSRANPEFVPPPHGPVDAIPDMVAVLLPYAGNSAQVFHCPSDTAPYAAYAEEEVVGSFPNYFAYARSSYGFTNDAFDRPLTSVTSNPKLRICMDALWKWHSEYEDPSAFTDAVNSLYGDGHVRFTPLVILN